ncbi:MULTISPECIES: alpha/beta fold hydrolase [Streptomyces]|uniref:Alpha/beta hydrolase n=1 Tax=Streptomyces katrae TaxID=68223 RepID=A0ABT7GVS4_9ACTN|nr:MULTISPECIES: alpha/beta hydrolase [Streptomyces]MDK9497726.1 alpha/beta hydrolase [Streptomyces katrae]GLX18897.1 alpha/beta hydrolase [Streptomyces lavendulae subsp. lavendulae]GLX29181.1 alpha/beta hydrolase [Streptomyces lavendulae subsp. lavendulae]
MDKVFSHDGTAIAYERTGRGPALVLVGGAFQRRGDFGELPALLAARFDVITYDRRGRGDSGDSVRYDVQREVEDLDALIALAGGTAFVHGMSSGAVLALEAAARGSAISRLSLYEPPFVVDESRPPLPADYLTHLEGLVADDARGAAVAYFLTHAVGVPADVVEGMRHAPFWADMEAVAHTLPYDGAVMGDTMSGRPLAPGRWDALADRLLVLDGGASENWIRSAADALPGLHRTLAGQDHGVAPDALAPALIEFFTTDETP